MAGEYWQFPEGFCEQARSGLLGNRGDARRQPEETCQPRGCGEIGRQLAFCRQHLHEADLSPQRVADGLGMSVRTLHWRFKQTGQTFGRWVRDNRLDGCAVALRDPNQRTFNISDVAYNWGFNDLSHFNKAFRARFSMTPREWRVAAANAALART